MDPPNRSIPQKLHRALVCRREADNCVYLYYGCAT